MALGTVTVVESGVVGDLKYAILDVVPTTGANYTANGESFDAAAEAGFPVEAFFAVATPADETSAASDAYVDIGGDLLVMFDAATGVEEGANQDLSGQTHRIFLLGR